MADANGDARKAAVFPTSSVHSFLKIQKHAQQQGYNSNFKQFLPADSSFCRGAFAKEQLIIVSIKPIALAARLPSGPETCYLDTDRPEQNRTGRPSTVFEFDLIETVVDETNSQTSVSILVPVKCITQTAQYCV